MFRVGTPDARRTASVDMAMLHHAVQHLVASLVNQQTMPVFHERLTHVTEASLLARSFAIQPGIRISRALVSCVRTFFIVKIDPAIARAASVRARRWPSGGL